MVQTRKTEPKTKSVDTAAPGTGTRRRPAAAPDRGVTPATRGATVRRDTTRAETTRGATVRRETMRQEVTREEAIGVRELRDSFSERLRSVRAGKTLTVTDHGEPVAMLIPYGLPAGILRMLSEGTLAWSGSKDYPPPFLSDQPLGPSSTEWYMKVKEEDASALDAAISASAADLRR